MIQIVQSPDLSWTAVRTKPRCEKVVANFCDKRDIVCYLPLRRQAKRYQRRTVESFLPMFPGYVFAQLHEQGRNTILQSHKIVTILPIDDVQECLLIEQLREIQLLEQASQEAQLVIQPKLVPGKPIFIKTGPFQGLTGIVQRRKQKARVTVNLEFLGQSVSAELDIGEVEIAEE